MKLLACALFIAAWTTSCQALIVPEDCNDARIEKSAEVALNLINEHRKEGYIFTLFRIADAHVQHVKNASIAYLTLDVLETQCPDLGQCKAVVHINELSKRKLLYAYNCTVSPVPPKLYECKDCPVRITVLEDTDKHTEEANKILEKYSLGSNESNYFKVEKVQKVISAVASRTVFIVEFTIKETKCPRNTDPASNLGFCIGRIVKETQSPDVVQVDSCEIYDIQTLSIFPHHHPHHFHHDSGEGHHHCNVTGRECRYRPHEHHPFHHHHHHPHHPHHHHHCHPHHNHHHHHHQHNHSHHPGHLQEYRDQPILGHYQAGPAGPKSNHNSEQTQEEHPDIPPPPGPQYPPPPPGGPHHLPPSKYPPPPPGPPPLQPFRHRPVDHHPRPCGRFPKCGHWHRCHHHHHRSNDTAYKREESQSLEEQDSFHHSSVGSVHHVPILNEHDVLQAPGANFLDHPLPDQGRHGKHTIQPFPEGSKSCPGKPKHDLLPRFLSLFPTPSAQ
ncbi:hypothetical protein Chor_014450 [Crotalus horridus]